MTTFDDGPAKGRTLMLTRTPWMLRVTERVLPESGTHIWDALNELKDRPAPDENLYAYILTGHYGHAFVDGQKFRGCVEICSYHIAPVQPEDAVMRDNVKWALWCAANDPRPKNETK